MGFVIGTRLRHAWNVFMNRDPTHGFRDYGMGASYRPDRVRMTRGNERSIVTSVYNRIALDVATIKFQHVQLDEGRRFVSVIDSGLDACLNLEANIDQTGRAFLQDAVMSMLDEGCVAMVPVDTDFNPEVTGAYDIVTMRTGKVVEWLPEHVRVRLYNERTGRQEEVLVPKSMAAIVENPLYAVINEPNSTMQRLIRKLNLLDVIDEQSGSGKLDLIIQLPYVIKTESRRQQAEQRRKDIEAQLAGTKYGIAYTDGTERITQLNRAVDNNLMSQIEYLTSMLYSQLGITQSILDGSADEKTMLNYYNRTIEPIVSAIVDEMRRKFLTKTARSRGHSIMAFRDPFKLVPVSEIAEIADKMTRNEIMTSNEIRQTIGMKPVDDPKADELRNSNLSAPSGDAAKPSGSAEEESVTDEGVKHHLMHHGVKGQKWGVQNGPPYPIDRSGGKGVAKSGSSDRIKPEDKKESKEVAKSGDGGKIRITVSGQKDPGKRGTPNSVIDHVRDDGSIKTRAFYDADVWKVREIHTSDHGKPKQHPYGEHGEHAHEYKWEDDGCVRTSRELSEEERKENKDIL